ncbi:MAG: MFS transporter [Candidatus Limnocylindrus sp. ZSMar2m-chloro-G89]|nr:MAG: MFS transporter [Candidatus Limnocylindrus sp. ZSMar2m-chloro-G89]
MITAPGWRGPFRHRNYRLFWGGQLVSLAGTWMQSIAQAWLITELTPDPVWLGVVAAAQFTPVLILGLFGGVIADVLPKRQMLIATQAALMGLAALQALLVATGAISIPLLLLLAVALGSVNAIDMPVRQSFFSEMVPVDEVGRAVAFNSAMFNGARVIGPAIGGVLIGVIGVAGCFAVNALSFLAVLVALLLMREVELHPAPRGARPRSARAVATSLAEGLRYVRNTPIIALCVFVIGVISGVAMNFNVIIPPLARLTLQIGAPGLGALMAAVGFGSLAGALTVAALREPRRSMIVIGGALLGAFSVAAGVAASSDSVLAVPLTALALFGAGFGAISMAATANASIQTTTPPALRGRVMSVYTTVFAGSTPIGGLATGAVVAALGATGALGVAGALAVAAAAYAAYRWRATIR